MTTRTQVIVPTAINIVTFVNDAIIASRRAGETTALISLPTLRERARMIVAETGTLHVVIDDTLVDSEAFTR